VGEAATTRGRIRAISISASKGTPKSNVPEAELKADFGVVGDAHAGRGPRQVSLLAVESIERFRSGELAVSPGEFAENITVEGLDLSRLTVGRRLCIAGGVKLEVTQIGKQCHGRCPIREKVGDCVMPREGIFARVVVGGRIQVGDVIEVLDD
jgi:MOSC domain-containing protein YiiM